jgi:hypothetical protein
MEAAPPNRAAHHPLQLPYGNWMAQINNFGNTPVTFHQSLIFHKHFGAFWRPAECLRLDLTAYAQVRQSSDPIGMLPQARRPDRSEAAPTMQLSAHDHAFLRALKIKADDSLPY